VDPFPTYANMSPVDQSPKHEILQSIDFSRRQQALTSGAHVWRHFRPRNNCPIVQSVSTATSRPVLYTQDSPAGTYNQCAEQLLTTSLLLGR